MIRDVKSLSRRRNVGDIRKRLLESWQWYVLLLPALVYLIIFHYGPIYGIQIAFKNYRATRGIWGSDWVGLKHFIRFFDFPNFWKLIRNTLSITLLSLATFPAGVLFALYLNEILAVRYKKTVQMITYMPHFLSEVVVCALLIIFLDRSMGPINNLVEALGGERQNYLGIPTAFAPIYVLSGLWQNLGWQSILYISALSSVPMEEIEAAKIDGASRQQIMWRINLPNILPTVIITFLLRVGGIMNVGFSKIFLLQNNLNLDYSNVISTYTYDIGLVGGQFSYAAAIGLFNNVINILVLLLVNQIIKRVSETSLF
jgi:putative aldouronate transport system permease protein